MDDLGNALLLLRLRTLCLFYALLADLESSTAHISKCPVFLPEETPYSLPSGGSLLQDDSAPPPLPPPPSSEALNGSLQNRPDSHHSSLQSLGSAQKSTLSRDSSSPPLSHTEEDHVYSFPNKQKPSDSSAASMSSALGSNLSELDRLLLELNAVQQNTPSFPTTEDAAPPLPPCSSAHYIQENGAHPGITLTPAAKEKPQRNGKKVPEEGRPTVESLLNELESSIPTPTPTPSCLQAEGRLDAPSEQQGRMSATSATRELDELMACLSDFKVQSNPSSLGSLNSEPLFDQSTNFSTVAEIHSPPATVAPVAASLTTSLPSKPASYFPLPSAPASLELHIVEDSNETGPTIPSSDPKSTPSSLLSAPSVFGHPSPRYTPVAKPGPDSVIDVSASMLSAELDSLVVLSQTITTTTTNVSVVSPGNLELSPNKPESPSLNARMKPASPIASVPIVKSPSPTSVPAATKSPNRESPLIAQMSNGLFHVPTPELKPASPSPIAVPVMQSPPKPDSPQDTTPPKCISPLSEPKTSSPKPPAEKPESIFVTPRPLAPTRLESPAQEPSLDDALDNLLAMSFSKPGSEDPPKLIQAARPEIFEEPLMAADRRVMQPDTHTESEVGDGLLEDQSDCRSDMLDWADMELKLPYDGADGSMTPMTEASWMDESLTPSSCPGTPDAQIDLPMLQHTSPMDRISASGHIKSVIRRTKETPNVHPMYRDGFIRRKMGPIIFHKSSSQDRLIEELQGKLGIARKERPKKQPDDWLTEGVIVMSNPKRSREDHNREVDKIIIPPESPLPQRKVIQPPQSPSVPRPPPPAEEPKRAPLVKAAPLPAPLPPPPPPAPSPPPREPTPPPQPPVEPQLPPAPVKPPTPEPVQLPPPAPKPMPAPTPPPVQPPPPAPVAPPSPPKVLVSVGCQTEYNPLFPPMQIMAQGKGPQTQVNKLDNMLGSLQSDLHKLGVQTVAKGVCGACCKPIVGQVVTAMGRTWHPEHFVCTHCQDEIGSRNFFERDGQPYCERDYHHLFSPRCFYCNGPILDKVVTALDRTWHPEHFFCAQCGAFFGPEGFHEKDGKAYCRKDYFDLFAPKCGGCARAILENYISALNSLWHPECFVCRECFTPFINGSFFEHDDQPYCEVHYHERRGSLCSGCQKPITGRCITAMGKKFHPEHFVCAFCLKQLNKGTFKEQNDKPYCHGCFVKLFS
ncbi:proline-rich protein 12 isoform X1 [Pygocentrus nattereri]|uniref:proline-rich protein 12 isoform X1 n=1 Tax=Pygocentrus nattereri TaxID=42514 RepID=UPI001891D43A|nr:proline-rich protein 12 isoform X1 [Pygocentrus nattereri]